MGRRGPAPKDPLLRQRRNRPAEIESVAALGALVTEPPPDPPDGLLERTKEIWECFWTSPVAGLIDRTSDLPALGRLFTLYDDADRFRMSIRESAMIKGAKGQMVRNPFVKDLKDTQTAILHLEDRFGLSPRARLGLNLSLTTAAKTMAELNEDYATGVDGADDPRFDLDGELSSETP